MTTVNDAIRGALDDGLGPAEAADRALSDLTRDDLAAVAAPLIHREARMMWRRMMRAMEDRVAAGHGGSVAAAFTLSHDPGMTVTQPVRVVADPSAPATPTSGPIVASRGRFAPPPVIQGLAFLLPTGERVLWGEATPAQHRERAAMQRRLAGRATQDAERHEEAAAVIDAAGVTCLNDLTTSHLRPETHSASAGGDLTGDASYRPEPMEDPRPRTKTAHATVASKPTTPPRARARQAAAK